MNLLVKYQFANTHTDNCWQALLHASVACNRKLCIDWVPACDLEDATLEEVNKFVSSLYSLFFDHFSYCLTTWLLSLAEPRFVQESLETVKGQCSFYLIIIYMQIEFMLTGNFHLVTRAFLSSHQQIYCLTGGRCRSSSRWFWRQGSGG